MADKNTSIEELKAKAGKFIKERDWDQFNHPKDVAMSISVEAGELLDHFIWRKEDIEEIKKDTKRMHKIREEFGDIIYCVLTFSNTLGIDISDAFSEKLEEIGKKYPVEKSKGNNRKYTEL